MNTHRAKGKAYGREEDLWRGLDELEAPPSESPRDSGDAARPRVLASSTATPMQTGACQCVLGVQQAAACTMYIGALLTLLATFASQPRVDC